MKNNLENIAAHQLYTNKPSENKILDKSYNSTILFEKIYLFF
ncbi:hypothetical protein JCM30566_12990 [Marinitoga arctica]